MQSAGNAEILRAKNALRMTSLENDGAHNAISAKNELIVDG
jgi:hypothetical protein